MKQLTLSAQKRKDVGKRQGTLRKKGLVPANLYGFKKDNINIEVENLPFLKVYEIAGNNTIIGLSIEDADPVNVIVRDVQHDPISGDPIHVDFFQINNERAIKTKIKIKLVGQAPAVKEKGGVLVVGIDRIAVVSLPSELMSEIAVDLTHLVDLGDNIRVKDLDLPKGMKVLSNPLDTLASVVLSRGARKASAAGVSITADANEEKKENVSVSKEDDKKTKDKK